MKRPQWESGTSFLTCQPELSSVLNVANQGTEETIFFTGSQSHSQHRVFMLIKFSFEVGGGSKLFSKSIETFVNDHPLVSSESLLSQWKKVYWLLSICKHSPVDTTAGPRAEGMENSLAAYWIQRKTGTSPTCAGPGAGFLFTWQHQMATLTVRLRQGASS